MGKVIAKKICMVGPFAVGKTSFVKRFVESIFSDKYLTTIGVKISKKQVSIEDDTFQLMIWDIEGVDVFTELKPSYLRGASGILLIIDGTRPKSLENASKLQAIIKTHLPGVPILGLLNKFDLNYEWKISESEIQAIENLGIPTLKTSAKSGQNVDKAFKLLTEKMGLSIQGLESI